jgi:hypothetical protein
MSLETFDVNQAGYTIKLSDLICHIRVTQEID